MCYSKKEFLSKIYYSINYSRKRENYQRWVMTSQLQVPDAVRTDRQPERQTDLPAHRYSNEQAL